MPCRRVVVFVFFSTLTASFSTWCFAVGPSTRAESLDRFVRELASDDMAVQARATEELTHAGAVARVPLHAALSSVDPETRRRISQILLHLPWSAPGDSDAVRALLANYGELPAEDRQQRVRSLAELPDRTGIASLIRVLQDDPNTAVRWTASGQLLADYRPGAKLPLETLRALAPPLQKDSSSDTAIDNAPLLATAGWAWRGVNTDHAAELLTRAVSLDAEQPAADAGETAFIYRWLIDRADEHRRFTQAVALLRQQAALSAVESSTVNPAVAELFAMHAEHGPLPGFEQDALTYHNVLNRAPVLYAAARLAERRRKRACVTFIEWIAFIQSGFSANDHLNVGKFLGDQGWLRSAERELRAALFLGGEERVNVYFQLARIAAERNDDLAVAQNLEAALAQISGPGGHALTRINRYGEQSPWSDSDAWAEVHWHYLRAARTADDLAAVQSHLQALIELDRLSSILLKDPGLATDIVPALKEAGRNDDAKKVFEAAYKELTIQLAADPKSAEAKNNLAWLCARCVEHLDQAVRLANEAVASVPANAAYLDTSAEAYFQAGKIEDAVMLESRAIVLRPDDVFMKRQLQRFQTALEMNFKKAGHQP